MGVGSADNAWWLDVLEWGPGSPHARSFDIDWNALPHRRHPGVLLPILGRPYGEALQSGEIQLKYDPANGAFAAWYFQHKLPINPQRYGEILRTVVTAAHAADDVITRELIAPANDYRAPRLPSYREAPDLKRRLRVSRAPQRRSSAASRPTAARPKPARGCCIACSNVSITASHIGASLSRR